MTPETKPLDDATWTPCDYPWDRWYEHARGRGVGEELAQLGRSVMREAYQHQWHGVIAKRYGWAAVDLDGSPGWIEVPGASGVRALRPGASLHWPVTVPSQQNTIDCRARF